MKYKKYPRNIWEWLIYAFACIMRNCFPDLSIMHLTKRTNPYGFWFLPRGRETAPGYYGIQGDIALSSSVEEFVKHLWSPVVIGHIFCKQPEKLTAVLQCPNIDYAWAIRCAYEELTKWHRSEPEVAFPLLEIILPKMTDPNLKMTEDDRKNWIEITCEVCSDLDFFHERVMDFCSGNNLSFLNRRCKLFSLLLKDENCLKALKSNSVWKELRDYLVKTVWDSEHIKRILRCFDLDEEEKKSLQQRLVDEKFRQLKVKLRCLHGWDKLTTISNKKTVLYVLGVYEDMDDDAVESKWAEIKADFIHGIETDDVNDVIKAVLGRDLNACSSDDLIKRIIANKSSAAKYFPHGVMRKVLAPWVWYKVKELVQKLKGLATANEIYPSMREFMGKLYNGIPEEVSKPIIKLTNLTALGSPEALWRFIPDYLRYYFVENEEGEGTESCFNNRVSFFISDKFPVMLQSEVAGYLTDEEVEIMWEKYYSTLKDENKVAYLKSLTKEQLLRIWYNI